MTMSFVMMHPNQRTSQEHLLKYFIVHTMIGLNFYQEMENNLKICANQALIGIMTILSA